MGLADTLTSSRDYVTDFSLAWIGLSKTRTGKLLHDPAGLANPGFPHLPLEPVERSLFVFPLLTPLGPSLLWCIQAPGGALLIAV